jgi:hypothetical protein
MAVAGQVDKVDIEPVAGNEIHPGLAVNLKIEGSARSRCGAVNED